MFIIKGNADFQRRIGERRHSCRRLQHRQRTSLSRRLFPRRLADLRHPLRTSSPFREYSMKTHKILFTRADGISGQARIFQFLCPEEIGITLNASYLMQPIKSVSGVLVVGRREIHSFVPKYPFCDGCDTHQCLDRMRSVRS